MFNVGSFEVLLICVIALLVLGPERLPGAVRTAGLWIGRFRRSFYKVKAEIERELNADEIRRQLHNESVMAEIEEAKTTVKGVAKEVEESANRIVNTSKSDANSPRYSQAQVESANAESEATRKKPLVEEISEAGEQLAQAGSEIKQQLYGTGTNPKLANSSDASERKPA
ncbi:MAG: Sec-independent protein translocase protein TatB [Gammaproteobacteria bacterium]|nr:Sec-independent protein translocase protein TatB [Gammaproteobacteria bacterium]MCY4357323.1 Sec-independent protein translocase protein TatB [Gammaproteobacteria bacterium]